MKTAKGLVVASCLGERGINRQVFRAVKLCCVTLQWETHVIVHYAKSELSSFFLQ
jgi:hypothetical protein